MLNNQLAPLPLAGSNIIKFLQDERIVQQIEKIWLDTKSVDGFIQLIFLAARKMPVSADFWAELCSTAIQINKRLKSRKLTTVIKQIQTSGMHDQMLVAPALYASNVSNAYAYPWIVLRAPTFIEDRTVLDRFRDVAISRIYNDVTANLPTGVSNRLPTFELNNDDPILTIAVLLNVFDNQLSLPRTVSSAIARQLARLKDSQLVPGNYGLKIFERLLLNKIRKEGKYEYVDKAIASWTADDVPKADGDWKVLTYTLSRLQQTGEIEGFKSYYFQSSFVTAVEERELIMPYLYD
jgi:hypothetical protein